MAWNDIQLRRYLLGDLADSETERLDRQVISDENSRLNLEAAEHELIEEYLEGVLSDRDRDLFNDRFLTSDRRREDLSMIVLLKAHAAGTLSPLSEEKSPFAGFIDNVFTRFRPLAAAAAILVIGLFSYVGWRVFVAEQYTPLEREFAALNRADLGLNGAWTTIPLAPGQLRDLSTVPRMEMGTLSESVLFRLVLPYTPMADSSFKVEVFAGDAKVFVVGEARAYSTPSGNEVRVLLPRTVLPSGQILLKTTNNADPSLTQTYAFSLK
ncbi:MAG: hypothetical protein AB7F88_15550 [Pyrinomonadaceae bacterium]